MTLVFLRLMPSLKTSHVLENRSRRFWSFSSLCETRAASSTKRKSHSITLQTLVFALRLAELKSFFLSDRVHNKMPSFDLNACFRRTEKMLKSIGSSTESCFTPLFMSNTSYMLP